MPENQPIRSKFKDFEVNTKIKLAFLWTAVTLCYLYGDYFELYTPGKVEGLISGDNLLNTPIEFIDGNCYVSHSRAYDSCFYFFATCY
jgi:hypothetical protein